MKKSEVFAFEFKTQNQKFQKTYDRFHPSFL